MKKSILLGSCICICMVASSNLSAQEVATPKKKQEVTISDKELKVKRHTIMQKFEPGMVLSPEERLAIKKERKIETERRFALIDSMDISNRKRRKLKEELLRTPYSRNLAKVTAVADTKFEDDENNKEDK